MTQGVRQPLKDADRITLLFINESHAAPRRIQSGLDIGVNQLTPSTTSTRRMALAYMRLLKFFLPLRPAFPAQTPQQYLKGLAKQSAHLFSA